MNPLASYSIKNFFRQFSPIAREHCHQVATAIDSGATVTPTSTQGSQSYTVCVGDGARSFIVQFRDPDYALDVGPLAAARETYGDLVPVCQRHNESLGPLLVYTMNVVSGDTLLHLNSSLHQPGNFHLLQQTVQDFAGFCASGWHNQPASMPGFSKASIQSDNLSRLSRIANDLPSSYQSMLSSLRSKMPSLFAHGYPIVINHWDLLENNIHTDAQTGQNTGIVDWRDAKAGPFAMQFWGLENILGIRRSTRMDFHPSHVELRGLFWQTLFAQIGDVSQATLDTI